MTLSTGCTIFIPVYNEESLLVSNVGRLTDFLTTLDTHYEIIIGSNGSIDRSVELGRDLSNQHPNIQFFHTPQRGVGAAFKEGVRMATYDRIITVDMDLSIELGFIRVAHKLLDSYDMVIGSKITGNQNRAWIRRMASTSFIALAGLLLQINFHDYSIAAKGYRKGFAERYLSCVDDKTFYVVEIVYRAHHDGNNLIEIPVHCHDKRESRFNLIHEGIYKFGNLFRLWLASLGRH